MKLPQIESTASAIVTLAGAVMLAGGAIAVSLPQSRDDVGMFCIYVGVIVGLFGLISLWRQGTGGLH